jgi:hypothetical protein
MRSRSTREELVRVIRSVRWRWRLRVLLRGAAIVTAAGVAVFLISAFGMDRLKFNPGSILAFRVFAYGALLVLLARYLALPLLKRVSDERVALYLEEKEPTLEARLLSAVEFGRDEGERSGSYSPALVERLVQTAVEKCEGIEFGRKVERESLRRSSGLLAGSTIAALAAVLLAPSFVRHATPFLLPWNGATPENPYSIEVVPGNARVARGAELKIIARLQNFETDEVGIAVQRGAGEGAWERLEMGLDEETGDYIFFLFDLEERTEYFVEAAGVRTPLFRIDVVELPYVERMTLEYEFPAYTGLEPYRQEDGGDIAAVRGTTVRLHVTPTVPVAGGAIALESGDTLMLSASEDGTLTGDIDVTQQDLYRITFRTPAGDQVVGSPDYLIDVLTDQPPVISFSEPGRDIQATNVEEVFTEVGAQDDYGVRNLELVYSVNGGAEQTITLYGGRRPQKHIRAGHTFYLEELDLRPGDFISYYARAGDDNRVSGRQVTTTDIYFMEVRPFDRRFHQADEMPGSGGSGDGFDSSLARRQRDIIAATFKLVRDRERYAQKEFNENLATLTLAQGRLREQVEGLLRRINARGIVQFDTTFREIAEALPLAIAAMSSAEERLGERKPGEALPPEQQALQQLQRAEAAFRDIQVARGGQSGGGGGEPNVEELAELFELELDKQRNQYESVQRDRQQKVDEQIDEITQRLQELARRQQQENERAQARARQSSGQGGSARSQRQLAEEAEELARRLERLAREESLPELNQTAQQLRRAAEEMRRAGASSRQAEAGEGLSALRQLREAHRELENNRAAGFEREVEDAARRARRLAQQQREMVNDVERLGEAGADRQERVQRITERKEQMAEELSELESDLDRLSRESRREQRDASRRLDEAADAIRDEKIKEKIRYSRGVVQQRSTEYARNFEQDIRENLESVSEKLEQAHGAIGESPEQRLAHTLDETHELTRSLESLRERILDRSGQRDPASEGQAQEVEGGGGERASGQESERGRSEQRQIGPRPGDRPPESSSDGFPGFTPEAVRQFQRELSERRGEAQGLREALREEGVDASRLDEVIGQMRRLERQTDFGDPRGLTELQAQIIQDLKEFEYGLRRQLIGDDGRELLLSGSEDVPSEYRELVEEYYRSLAEGSRKGGG